jgi:hypothetical protein
MQPANIQRKQGYKVTQSAISAAAVTEKCSTFLKPAGRKTDQPRHEVMSDRGVVSANPTAMTISRSQPAELTTAS